MQSLSSNFKNQTTYSTIGDDDKNSNSNNNDVPSLQDLHTVWGNVAFSLKYVTRDTKKRFFSFLVGLITIVIVVFVVSALYNGVLKASIVFMKLAEDQIGEMDLIFFSRISNSTSVPLVNETQLSQMLFGQNVNYESNHLITGTTPRWILTGNVANYQDPSQNTTCIILVIDSEREQRIGLGRSWPYRVLGEGEAHVRDSILRAIDVKAQRGQKVNIKVSLSNLQSAFSGMNQGSQQQSFDILNNNDINNNNDNDDPSPIDIGEDNLQINPEQLLRQLMQQAGFDFDRVITINATQVVEQLEKSGVDVPPFIEIIAKQVGSVNVTVDQLYKVLTANGTNIMFDAGIASEYTVIDAIDYPYGKYPSALGNIIVVDSNYLLKTLGNTLLKNPYLKIFIDLNGGVDNFVKFTEEFPINEYSLSVVAMYKNRFKTYIKNTKERLKEVIGVTNELTNILGVEYPVSIQFPLMLTLDGLQFITLFLNQIFVGVVVMLAILGVILIYALLLSNVEEKTYEYGMLRALGLQKYSLIQVIITQAFYFAIPGIAFGMVCSFLSNILVEYLIREYVVFANYNLKYTLDVLAVIIPIALGLSIPLVANIVPIRTALSRTLRDSLDIAHQTFNETKVTMVRLEKLGLEPWQTGVAVCLVVGGFVVYYVVPASFIFQNLSLFFGILNCILLSMLIGLCMIAVVLQPFLERITLHGIVHGPDRKMKTLIFKNLAGHRKRSRKTFLMFSLAIAFVIFAGVSFSLQIESLNNNVKSFVGADALIKSTSSSVPLKETELNAYLDKQIQQGVVDGYCYQSFSLSSLEFIRRTRLGSLSYRTIRTSTYAISSNYLDVAYSKYYLYTTYDKEFTYDKVGGKPDVVKSLYKDAGKATVDGERQGFSPQRVFTGLKVGLPPNASEDFDPSTQYKTYVDVIISQAMNPAASISQNSPSRIRVYPYYQRISNLIEYVAKPRALVYKFPGYIFSSYELAAFNSPVLITFDSYVKIANASALSVGYTKYNGEIPKEKLLIKFKTTNSTQIQDILNELKSICNADYVNIANTQDLLKSTKTTSTALLSFFNIVAAIAVILCFFILTVSFTANVRDNSWEFGVLRAIGFSVNQLIRAYIYEALCLVISAFLCGTSIGIVIAVTLVAQFNVFLEMPFEFAFPYYLFFSLAAMALVVAIVGSYIPARVLKRKEIAFVLRGLE